MRTWFAWAFASALALSLPLAASADDAATVRKKVKANYAKMMAAYEKHDLKGVMSVVADDYEGVGDNGTKMNKAQVEAMMKQYINDTIKVNSWKYTVTGLKVSGNKATGVGTFNLDAKVKDSTGMMGPKGKTHQMTVMETYKTIWTKKGSDWLTSRETPAAPPKATIDGKPFNPGAPRPPKPSKAK